jgi:hypothetical protein
LRHADDDYVLELFVVKNSKCRVLRQLLGVIGCTPAFKNHGILEHSYYQAANSAWQPAFNALTNRYSQLSMPLVDVSRLDRSAPGECAGR